MIGKEFTDLILKAKYEQAMKEFENYGEAERGDIVLELSCETESLSVFGFLDYLQLHGWPKTQVYKWFISVLINPLCFMEGAYALGLYYARNLAKLEPIEENVELLLFFNEISEKLVGDEEAELIANGILKLYPENKAAKKFLHRVD